MIPLSTSSCDAALVCHRLPPVPLRPVPIHVVPAGTGLPGRCSAKGSGVASAPPNPHSRLTRRTRPGQLSPALGYHRPSCPTSSTWCTPSGPPARSCPTTSTTRRSPAILTAATHAPSAENSQPFVFVVVRDPDAAGRHRRADGAPLAGRRPGARGGAPLSRLPARRRPRAPWAASPAAPVLIVVCGDTRLTFAAGLDASVFPAVQNLLLAAHALGLGLDADHPARPRRRRARRPARPAARGRAGRRRPARPPAQAARPAPAPAALGEGPPEPLRHALSLSRRPERAPSPAWPRALGPDAACQVRG